MATAVRTPSAPDAPLTASRKSAFVMGALYLATYVTSIPAVLLYNRILNDPNYIVGGGPDTRVLVGAFLEVLLIMANIGTTLALYSILRRQHEGLALGYVAARIMESVFIGVGILSVLSIVTLRRHAAGADAASLIVAGRTLVAVHDWTFLLGPGMCGLWNGLILGYLLYRSGLMPRRLTYLGLIGGPLLFLSGTGALFGLYGQTSTVAGIMNVPEMIWEPVIGIYFVVKALKPAVGTSMPATRAANELVRAG